MEVARDSATEAVRLVNTERQSDYGHPKPNMDRTACIWSGILGISVTPRQVALCMIGLKLAREAHRHKDDNVVDIHGWANVLDAVIAAERETGENVVVLDGDHHLRM